ncbi:MAG: hypothetical protein ABSE89_07440 [Sedimentisphaerales bacterium]
MPITPYHFGPSGLLGYIFRKWIDLPVFVLANVVVDIEVLVVDLMDKSWPIHRYCHTFLIGAVLGAMWGFVAYLYLPLMTRLMKMVKIPYQTNAFKMVASGIIGVWLHVFIDGIYHYDIKPFWPVQKNYLFQLLSQNQVIWICLICFAIFVLLYVISLKKQSAKGK